MHLPVEVAILQKIIDKFEISIQRIEGRFLGNDFDQPLVQFQIKKSRFEVFVDNEYDDLSYNNPMLDLCLVLRSLEEYQDAEDYLIWCRNLGLDARNEETRAYHMSLGKVFEFVERTIGEVSSYVSDYAFTFNSGAAQYMRQM